MCVTDPERVGLGNLKNHMIKVMHVITTLGPAGAETMLCRVAAGMDGTRFENEVVSLTGVLDLAERMQAIGVRVRTLGHTEGSSEGSR